ncbi:TonB-dependent receptor [bacterium]|nr:TonB-dependent receptor [bacterium]
MLRGILILLLTAIAAPALAAGTGTVRGTVLTETGQPLKGAQVSIRGTKLGTVALSDGKYEIMQVPSGYCQLIAWMTGFETRTERVYVPEGQAVVVRFALKESIIPLPAVEVSDSVPRVSVTATIVPMDIKVVPSAVEIISDETIQEMGALTVADALMDAQSLYLQGDEERSLSASLRGLRTNQTLILINGRRVAAGLRENVNLDDLPTAMIQRIEIVRGPSSALYGSDAIGGVINIITKKPPEDMVAGVSVRYGQSKYGEDQNPFIKGYMAERVGQLGYSLFACLDHEGQFDRYKETPWTDGDRRNLRSGGVDLSMDLTGRQLVQGGFEKSLVKRRGVRPYDWGDGKRRTDDNRKSFYLEYNYVIPERTEFTLRGNYYQFNTDISIDPEIYGDVTNPLTGSDQDYNLEQRLKQVETRLTQHLPAGNSLTLGAESRWEQRNDNTTYHEVRNTAAFLQDIFQPRERFLTVLGARVDDHSQFGATFSPKASFTLGLLEPLRLKGSYGRGVRAPSIYELYIENPSKESLVLPNIDLKAEKSNSWEIGLEGEYWKLKGDVRYFRNDLTDMINPVQTGFDTLGQSAISHSTPAWVRPVLQYRNVEKALSHGFELSLSARLTDRIVFSDDATVMQTKDKTTDKRLLNKPDMLNTAELRWEDSKRRFKTGVRLASVGTRIISDTYRADGYSLVHLFASKRFSESFEVYGGVNNLLNNDPNIYGFTEGAGTPGTYFFLGFTLETWDHNRQY